MKFKAYSLNEQGQKLGRKQRKMSRKATFAYNHHLSSSRVKAEKKPNA